MIDPLELIDPKPYREHPTSCPKCRGDVCPHYIAARLPGDGTYPTLGSYSWPEQLVWHCTRCGWKTTTACADVGGGQAPAERGPVPEPTEPRRWWKSWPTHNLLAHPVSELL